MRLDNQWTRYISHHCHELLRVRLVSTKGERHLIGVGRHRPPPRPSSAATPAPAAATSATAPAISRELSNFGRDILFGLLEHSDEVSGDICTESESERRFRRHSVSLGYDMGHPYTSHIKKKGREGTLEEGREVT
jgi:hypothetical protein